MIVFFDGMCGLCNKFVSFLFARDKKSLFKVAPLQGRTAEVRLPVSFREGVTTLVVCTNDGKLLTRSDAVLFVLCHLGGVWTFWGKLGYVFPRFFRDAVYGTVAKTRYNFFGRLNSCRMPTPEEKTKFLD